MNAYIGLFFDILILCALGGTIFYALRLSKQIDRMQADRKAFEQLISALNVAASRAESAIKSLKETAVENGDRLQDKINKARGLADELEIMIEAGDSLANRLSVNAEKSRKAAESATPARHEPAVESRQDQGRELAPRTKAEKDLLDAIRAKQQS